MRTKKALFLLIDVFSAVTFVYLTVFPDRASVPTREALVFCFSSLVPAVFMYSVLSKLIISLPITERLSKVFGTAPIAAFISLLCGAPVGARIALSLYNQGAVSKRYAEYLLSFCVCPSLPFTVGFVGGTLFGSTPIGLKLLLFQVISMLVVSLALKFSLPKEERSAPRGRLQPRKRADLREAISEGAESMISVCACAVFFIVCSSVLKNMLALPPLPEAITKALLEFSSGCAAAAKLARYSLAVSAFSLGWCGLSVALQVQTAVGNRLSIRLFFLGRLVSGAVMTILAVIFG
jgi:hypothetical protein